MALITAQTIPDASVYGIPQMSYTVGDVAGQDYSAVVRNVTLVQACAFEAECNALSAMVRVRMKKLEDLGEALSVIAGAIGSLKSKDAQTDDIAKHSGLTGAKELMARYGLTLRLRTKDGVDLNEITRENASYAQNDVQYAMDREDNDLQQDMLTVQSIFKKRDNAFSTSSRLVSKVHNSAQSVISNFGG